MTNRRDTRGDLVNEQGIPVWDKGAHAEAKKTLRGIGATVVGAGAAGASYSHRARPAGKAGFAGGLAVAAGGSGYTAAKRRKALRMQDEATRGAPMVKRDPQLVIDEAIAKAARLQGDNQRAEGARGRRTAGLTGAGLGYLAASRTGDIAPGVADLVTGGRKVGGKARDKVVRQRALKMKRAGGKAGAVLVGAGLLAAGEGAYSDLHHRDSFRRARLQAKGKLQETIVGKSVDYELAKAFDSERSRHSRNAAYTGAAAGGAVVVGAGAAGVGRKGLKLRALSRKEADRAATKNMAAQAVMGDMTARGSRTSGKGVREAAKLHQQAMNHATVAQKVGGRAKVLTHTARGGAAGAVALGAAAAGIHTYDRRRGGRSYGY